MPRAKTTRGPGRQPADRGHGRRFKEMLLGSNMSLRDLGDAIGVTRQGVQRWKDRGVPAVHVVQVATLLGCTVAYLRPDVFHDIDDRR